MVGTSNLGSWSCHWNHISSCWESIVKKSPSLVWERDPWAHDPSDRQNVPFLCGDIELGKHDFGQVKIVDLIRCHQTLLENPHLEIIFPLKSPCLGDFDCQCLITEGYVTFVDTIQQGTASPTFFLYLATYTESGNCWGIRFSQSFKDMFTTCSTRSYL